MRKLRYGNDSELIRIEFPYHWDPSSISAITLGIKDNAGNELLSASAATIWTPSSVDGTIDAFSNSFTLDTGATAVSQGDRLLISGASGGEEKVVKGYNSTSKIVTVSSIFQHGHSDGDDVFAMWATIEVDLSDTAKFTQGLEMVFTWTPTGTGTPFTEVGYIAKYDQADFPGLTGLFQSIFPRAYFALAAKKERLSEVVQTAVREVKNRLLEKDATFDIDRLVNPSEANLAVASACAYFWALGADEDLEDERKAYLASLDREINGMCSRPIWIDDNRDRIEDPLETKDRPMTFHKGW